MRSKMFTRRPTITKVSIALRPSGLDVAALACVWPIGVSRGDEAHDFDLVVVRAHSSSAPLTHTQCQSTRQRESERRLGGKSQGEREMGLARLRVSPGEAVAAASVRAHSVGADADGAVEIVLR